MSAFIHASSRTGNSHFPKSTKLPNKSWHFLITSKGRTNLAALEAETADPEHHRLSRTSKPRGILKQQHSKPQASCSTIP